MFTHTFSYDLNNCGSNKQHCLSIKTMSAFYGGREVTYFSSEVRISFVYSKYSLHFL